MIAIPNMDKPKVCADCSVNDMVCGLWMEVANIKAHKHKDCPLIEIVTCSECKHLEVINGAKIYAHCSMWEIDFEPFEDDTRTNYCSWGKRRADDSN